MVPLPPRQTWLWLVQRALEEDVGPGDASAELLPPELTGTVRVEARESIAVAGLPMAAEVFHQLGLSFEARAQDGCGVEAGAVLAQVTGPARALLTAERTALNFLQRLSGIATTTRSFCDAVRGTAMLWRKRRTKPASETRLVPSEGLVYGIRSKAGGDFCRFRACLAVRQCRWTWACSRRRQSRRKCRGRPNI